MSNYHDHYHGSELCTDKRCDLPQDPGPCTFPGCKEPDSRKCRHWSRSTQQSINIQASGDPAEISAAVSDAVHRRFPPTELHDCREDLRHHPVARRSVQRSVKTVENVIFNIRWMLIPFYIGLAGVLAVYGYVSIKGIIEFFANIASASIDDAKLFAFDTIDVVMIANLIKMIGPGSYNSYVSKQHGYVNENISSGELKTKIATSVVILSMVHLLKSLVSAEATWDNLERQLILFGAFLIGSLILSVIEYIHTRSEQHEVEK